MNSTQADDARLVALQQWLSQCPEGLRLNTAQLAPVSGDASFRRYFRLPCAAGTCIAMDAPPEREDSHAFVALARRLADAGLRVPEILASDLEQGFLLVSDLGPDTLYQRLRAGLADDPAALRDQYLGVIRALVQMQKKVPADGLARYDRARMADDMVVFEQWYLRRFLQAPIEATTRADLMACYKRMLGRIERQATVFVHRDFHSPNLLPGQAPDFVPGLIDFQDAVCGPIAYDIASLVMDARFDCDEDRQLSWTAHYWHQAREAGLPVNPDFARFHDDVEWTGLQRNLRILGVFARLALRDNKRAYLEHMPRVRRYVRQVAARHSGLRGLLRVLDRAETGAEAIGLGF